MGENWTADSIRAGLLTRSLGQNVIVRDSVDSTNTEAGRLASQDAPDGTLVIADYQTAGRGRLRRPWLAPAGTSLLFSLLFRPRLSNLASQPAELATPQAYGLVMACSLGIRAAIRSTTGLPAQIKWPNDVLIGGLKVGGILSELSASRLFLDYVIVGIGLNVNLDPDELPRRLAATSISRELGREVDRIPVLQAALLQIERRYAALLAGLWPANEWAGALETLGKRLRLETGRGTLSGLAEGVDDEGALLLRLDDGGLERVLVGDIVTA